jgi:hypothetical protein
MQNAGDYGIAPGQTDNRRNSILTSSLPTPLQTRINLSRTD